MKLYSNSLINDLRIIYMYRVVPQTRGTCSKSLENRAYENEEHVSRLTFWPLLSLKNWSKFLLKRFKPNWY